MLNLKGLAEMFVIDATERGHNSQQIRDAFKVAIQPLLEKEKRASLEEDAKELTFDSTEDEFAHAMGEYWDSDEMYRLTDAMRIRFPKHHKSIDKIIELAGDASNEREDMGKYGPSKEFEDLFGKVVKRLKKLPW